MMETGSHAYPVFKADFTEDALKEFSASRRKWNAPGTMPQELVRMTYRVNDVRLEPLAAVSATEAIREGTTPCALRELCDRRCEFCAQSEQMVRSYRKTWNASVNENRSTYGAEANPWTWVFRLERVKHFAGTSELPW